MARLWSSGAELQSVTSGMEFETVTGSPTISTTTKNGGAAALRFNPTAAAHLIAHTFQADTVNTTYHRFYLYIATAPSANAVIWQHVDSANADQFDLILSTSRTLWLGNGSATQIAGSSASSALNTAQWYRIEIKVVDNATTAAQMELKIDGTVITSPTGLTGVNGGGRIRFGVITSTTADIYIDDIAVNDTAAGTGQTAYPGAGSITHLYPTGAGDNAGWTPLASTNVSNVNETPTPNDATSYNAKTTTGTVIDDFTVTSPATAGIGSSDTISLVQIGIRGGSTATTAGATINARVKSASGGTVSTGAADAYNVNGWRTNGATPFQYGLTSYTDPTTAAAWTVTGTNSLTNMQIGYTNAASNTTVRRVSSVWALVESIPSASVNASISQLAATITATGGTQTVVGTAIVSAAISQVAATVTATGGTQTAQSRATVAQLAATITATGGTQAILSVSNASITQVAATITAMGGTQVALAAFQANIVQVAATVTATGSTQAVAASRKVALAQLAATVTATGGTQVLATNRFVSLAQLAAIITATGGTQVLAAQRLAQISQVAANILATGGTQSLFLTSVFTYATITLSSGTNSGNDSTGTNIVDVSGSGILDSVNTQINTTNQSGGTKDVTLQTSTNNETLDS